MIGNKSRVFKVIKTPVDDREAETLPAHMKDLLGFEFFAYKDGAPLELDPDFGPEYSQLYIPEGCRTGARHCATAQDIAGRGQREQERDPKGSPTRGARQAGGLSCRVQLRPKATEGAARRGAEAPRLPGSAGPAIAGGRGGICCRRGELLTRCALSIHLVGEKYGAVPDGPTDRSASMIQNEVAVARCRAGGLKRLIWLPQGTGSEDDRQRKFIAALHGDAQAQFGADLIAGDIEELRERSTPP